MDTPQPLTYDRFLEPVTCDLCHVAAAWTIRYRFAGESFHELHTCSRHRRRVSLRCQQPRVSGETPIEFQRVARTAF